MFTFHTCEKGHWISNIYVFNVIQVVIFHFYPKILNMKNIQNGLILLQNEIIKMVKGRLVIRLKVIFLHNTMFVKGLLINIFKKIYWSTLLYRDPIKLKVWALWCTNNIDDLFGLRPQTQPIYSFGIGVPKWPLFLWWFPISLYYKYALYCKCWEPPILTSGILTSDRGFPGNTLFHIFSLGFW